MNLGLSLAAFRSFSLDQALEIYGRLADRYQLALFELNLQIPPGRPPVWPWEVPEERIRSFAGRFVTRGSHLPFFDLHPIAANRGIREESRKQLREAIDLSARLGMTYVVAHASGSCNGGAWKDEKLLWIDLFRDLAGQAGRQGLTFCIENGECLSRLDRLLEVIAEAGGETRACVDVGHAHQRLSGGGPIASRLLPRLDRWWPGSFRISRSMPYEPYGTLAGFLREAAPCIHHFHLHDCRARFDHLGLGEGAVDLGSLAPWLRRKPVILEIPRTSEAKFSLEIEKAADLMNGGGER